MEYKRDLKFGLRDIDVFLSFLGVGGAGGGILKMFFRHFSYNSLLYTVYKCHFATIPGTQKNASQSKFPNSKLRNQPPTEKTKTNTISIQNENKSGDMEKRRACGAEVQIEAPPGAGGGVGGASKSGPQTSRDSLSENYPP